MGILPSPTMPFQLSLRAILSFIVLTSEVVNASSDFAPTQTVRSQESVQLPTHHDGSSSAFPIGLGGERYTKAIGDYMNLAGIVQLIAMCGFFQIIRLLWRRRSISQEEEMGDAGYSERKASSTTNRRWSRGSTVSSKLGTLEDTPTSDDDGV